MVFFLLSQSLAGSPEEGNGTPWLAKRVETGIKIGIKGREPGLKM
jgi:hypothetical protein